MRFQDEESSQRVSRILDAARASATSAADPPEVWPSAWPPGVEADPSPPGGVPRWQVPGRAALGIGLLAVLAVVVVVLLQLRGASSGTVLSQPVSAVAASPAAAFGASGAPPTPAEGYSSAAAVSAASPSAAGQSSAGMFRVYVVGQVRRPQVVSLAPGSRVEDAVDAAGGATERADLTVMNLARPVVDGERIVVPRPGQKLATADPVPVPAATAAGGAAGAAGGSAPGTPVDLNTATVADLDALPGVGPVLAGRIVEWRQQNGGFKTVDDLGEVSGIGDATLAKLRPLVRV
jgi:competence protein ComEA